MSQFVSSLDSLKQSQGENLIFTSLTKKPILFAEIKMKTVQWIKPSMTVHKPSADSDSHDPSDQEQQLMFMFEKVCSICRYFFEKDDQIKWTA